MKILVTGSNGQLGQELQIISKNYPTIQFYFTDRNELDISSKEEVNRFFQENPVDYCINCAAYTAVDKAETGETTAKSINILGVENLAEACSAHQAKLIHFSTDYVYHSENTNTPYSEDSPLHPKGVYAETKLGGELVAQAKCKQTIVIRTSWVYSSFGNNFVKTMLRLSEKLNALRVIFDQVGTPTYARDLAEAVMHIIQKIENEPTENYYGTFNYSNEGVTSWYDFAKAIFEIKRIEMEVTPIETKDYPSAALRPHFSLMNKQKIKSTFGLTIPHWRDSLKKCLSV